MAMSSLRAQSSSLRSRAISSHSSGQAMVEFVILLIVIMALCSGMLYCTRLLSADYWAQQEARYLAFEQEWAPREEYVDSVAEPIQKLDDRLYFHRPRGVDAMDTDRKVDDAGGLNQLMSFLLPKR